MGSRSRLPVFIHLALPLGMCTLLGGKASQYTHLKMGKSYYLLYKVAVRIQRINTREALRAGSGIDEAPSKCSFSLLLLQGYAGSIIHIWGINSPSAM